MWKRKGKRHLEDLGIDRILLNLILKNIKVQHGLNQSGSGLGQVTGCYENGLCKVCGIS